MSLLVQLHYADNGPCIKIVKINLFIELSLTGKKLIDVHLCSSQVIMSWVIDNFQLIVALKIKCNI